MGWAEARAALQREEPRFDEGLDQRGAIGLASDEGVGVDRRDDRQRLCGHRIGRDIDDGLELKVGGEVEIEFTLPYSSERRSVSRCRAQPQRLSLRVEFNPDGQGNMMPWSVATGLANLRGRAALLRLLVPNPIFGRLMFGMALRGLRGGKVATGGQDDFLLPVQAKELEAVAKSVSLSHRRKDLHPTGRERKFQLHQLAKGNFDANQGGNSGFADVKSLAGQTPHVRESILISTSSWKRGWRRASGRSRTTLAAGCF